MTSSARIVVFSHVDGLLGDLRAHSLNTAAGALGRLSRQDVSIVLCSSRTRAELEHFQQELGIAHQPLISENGAAAFVPAGYFGFDVPSGRAVAGYQAVEFGRAYPSVVEALNRTASRAGIEIRGFCDMSVEEVARDGGLTLLQARLAKFREYEEVFRILDPNPAARGRLFKALRAAHLRCISGSRYDAVGAPVDIGLGVDLLRTLYQRAGPTITVGVADPLAHGSLLQLVDYPVIVQSDGTSATPRLLTEAPPAGVARPVTAAGWAAEIVDVVQRVRSRPVTAGTKTVVTPRDAHVAHGNMASEEPSFR